MSAGTRPWVIVHNAVSADGRIDGFEPDIGVFYELAATFREDVTLTGADTILAAAAGPKAATLPPPPDGPLLAVTDSRGRIENWGALTGAGIWRGALALCAQTTPESYVARLPDRGVQYARCGRDRVDLPAALQMLAGQHGARTVRVDSGGQLGGALLRQQLVDEVSLLVHPVLVGGSSPSSPFRTADLSAGTLGAALAPPRAEAVGDGLLWLRWTVQRREAVGGVG